MSVPSSRNELFEQLEKSFNKLKLELNKMDDALANEICVDNWTIKDLIAVRLWWTRKVVFWIYSWKDNESPPLPAEGYTWRETPQLNNDIVKKSKSLKINEIFYQLLSGYSEVTQLITKLSDDELMKVGIFKQAGNVAVIRWISINTVRQYTTARTYIRRVLRKKGYI